VRKKDQINIETKNKTVRFIGELTKFKMFTKNDTLHCLKEQMMRKKQAMHLDARYVTMVENAYYYCNPPPAEKTVRKKRPPLQEYVRKLLYKDLSKVTTEKRYVWWKKSLEVWTKDHPFPIDIDYMISDTLELLRPKIKLCNSLEESIRQVQDLEREFLIKLGLVNDKESKDSMTEGDNLEEDEEEEEGGAETEEQSGNESEVNEPEEDHPSPEEMLQSLAQRPAPANTNRERRPRYQHPKGAPNADLIFKTEKRNIEEKHRGSPPLFRCHIRYTIAAKVLLQDPRAMRDFPAVIVVWTIAMMMENGTPSAGIQGLPSHSDSPTRGPHKFSFSSPSLRRASRRASSVEPRPENCTVMPCGRKPTARGSEPVRLRASWGLSRRGSYRLRLAF
ncbi:hypothetical protein A6R68_01028, partial [Neotoma lepida]